MRSRGLAFSLSRDIALGDIASCDPLSRFYLCEFVALSHVRVLLRMRSLSRIILHQAIMRSLSFSRSCNLFSRFYLREITFRSRHHPDFPCRDIERYN